MKIQLIQYGILVLFSSFLLSGSYTVFNPITAFELAYDEPIEIFSNLDFQTYASSGAGTPEDPYILIGLDISSSSTCITIQGTDAYFIIRDCELTTLSDRYYTIQLNGVSNGLIESCRLYDSYVAISLYGSNNTQVINCSFDSCYFGVYFYHSNCCDIISSTVTYGTQANYGFGVNYSNNITISENNVQTLLYSIHITNSMGIYIKQNSISSEYDSAIEIDSCVGGMLYENTIKSGLRPSELPKYFEIFDLASTVSIQESNDWVVLENSIASNETLSLILQTSNELTLENNTMNTGIFQAATSGVYKGNMVHGSPLGVFSGHSHEIDGSLFGQVILIDCENSSITGGTFTGAPLLFEDCYNCTLSSCDITDVPSMGVSLISSDFCHISNLDVSESMIGVFLDLSDYCFLTNSRLHGNYSGVYLDHSFYTSIEECQIGCSESSNINEFKIGVRIEYSDYLDISNNQIESLAVNQIRYGTISNNIFERGILFEEIKSDSNFTIMANTINGRPIKFIRNPANASFEGDIGQIIVIGCSDIIIKDFRTYSVLVALQLLYTHNTLIENVEVSNSTYGIYLLQSSNSSILDSVFDKVKTAINSFSTDQLKIRNITVTNSRYGLNADELMLSTVEESCFIDCYYGLQMGSSGYINVTDCLFKRISENGIICNYCEYLTIIGNRFVRNDYYGVMLFRAEYCVVYLNEFVNSRAFCYGFNNTWDNGVDTGNWWSDYSGTGSYTISGGLEDRWPMVYTLTPPTLYHHEDVTFSLSDVRVIYWEASDNNPDIYRVYIDDNLHFKQTWNGASISIDVSDLQAGVYVLRLEVEDDDGCIASGGIVVTISSDIDLVGSIVLIGGFGILSIIVAGFLLRYRSSQSMQ